VLEHVTVTRRLGLRVPELVLADLDPRIPGSEPDPRSTIV